MKNKTDRFTVGQIVNTHGLKGELKVKSFTASPEDFEDFETLLIEGEGEKRFVITSVRYVKGLVLIKFEGLDDINLAERFKTREVYRLRSDYGQLEEGEHFIVDLIGLEVVDRDRGKVGIIGDVITNGAQNLYVVKREGQPDFLIPVVNAFVQKVDIEAGCVHVTLIEGMME